MPSAKLIPRCDVCAERLAGDQDARCPRCAARPDPAALPPVAAAYDPSRRWAPLYHFAHGARFFLAAIPYTLRTSGIKRHIAVPIAVTLLLLVLTVAVIAFGINWLVQSSERTGEIARAAQSLFTILIVAGVLVVAYLAFFPLARLLLAPFADKISERVEELALGARPQSPFALAPAVGDAAHSVFEALKMLAFQALVMVPLLLVLFVPVLGQVLVLVVGVFFSGLGALDIAMGRKRMRLGEKLSLAFQNLGLVLGLGTAIYLVVLVPVVNLLAIPIGAVAGTMAFLRLAPTRLVTSRHPLP
jgi:CysZ protein